MQRLYGEFYLFLLKQVRESAFGAEKITMQRLLFVLIVTSFSSLATEKVIRTLKWFN